MYAMESAVDDLARELGMDPIDLRLLNAADEGTQAPYGPTFPPIGIRKCLEVAKAHPNYATPKGEGVGRGIAAGFWFNIGMQSSAGGAPVRGTARSPWSKATRTSAGRGRPCA